MKMPVITCLIALAAYGQDNAPVSAAVLSKQEKQHIAGMPPQQQAMRLMERCITGHRGAQELLAELVPSWRGKIAFDRALETLLSTAYNASNLQVRRAAMEVSLAAYDMEKTQGAVDALIEMLRSATKRQTYLWQLGLL